ncbi:hypothetical protein J6590_103088 [Homalodisca vitripennis]|nr:hypothetical protein J6590_103088 [Homalodisca vitripennis]
MPTRLYDSSAIYSLPPIDPGVSSIVSDAIHFALCAINVFHPFTATAPRLPTLGDYKGIFSVVDMCHVIVCCLQKTYVLPNLELLRAGLECRNSVLS